jgi:hypothetical protein
MNQIQNAMNSLAGPVKDSEIGNYHSSGAAMGSIGSPANRAGPSFSLREANAGAIDRAQLVLRLLEDLEVRLAPILLPSMPQACDPQPRAPEPMLSNMASSYLELARFSQMAVERIQNINSRLDL